MSETLLAVLLGLKPEVIGKHNEHIRLVKRLSHVHNPIDALMADPPKRRRA